MKKVALTLTALCVASLSFAQKLQKPNVDKITGITSVATTSEKIYAKASFSGTVGEQVYSTLLKTDSTAFLILGIQSGKTSVFLISEDQKAFLKLSDGAVITLKSIGDELSNFTAVSYGGKGRAAYQLTKQDLDTLSKMDVTFIRVEHSGGTFEYDIKPKGAELLKAQAALINN